MSTRSISEPVPSRSTGSGFILGAAMILVFAMAARTAVDSDMWWHLRAGEQTVSSGRIVLQDDFSYTRAGAAWTNHSWLAQVGMYLVFHWGGYVGLGVLVASLATLSMFLVYQQLLGPPILRAFIILQATLVAALVWSPRPQLGSLVLFALVGYLLYLYKWKRADRLWALVPVFALWSNLHAGYVLGLLLIGAFLSGELLNHLLAYQDEDVLSWKRILRLLVWTLGASLAVLLNPNGLQTWLVPFRTVEVNALQNLISEWASPNFHELAQQPFIWMLLLTLAAVGFSARRLDGSDLAVLGLFAYLALMARRNFGPFALATAPILSRHLWPALQTWWSRVLPYLPISWRSIFKPRPLKVKPALQRSVNVLILVILAAAAGEKLYLANSSSFINKAISELYPQGAVEWVRANHPAGRLFNSYNWGGYLIWWLRDYPVFLDGRTDLYNDEIIGQWVRVVAGDSGWQAILERWGVRLVLLEPDQPLVRLLPAAGWKLLYQDNHSVLYGR